MAGACTEGCAVEIFIYCKILGECSASFALFSCKGYMWGGELQFYPTAAILLEIEKIFQITGGQDVQPETSWILSRKQAGSSAGNRQGFESRTGEKNFLTV